ncbi:MAG: response regulator transcription factor [Peptococcaceae bacterium]|nr:response regulator transcription factor [Peptococcaceae bacterium]
MAEILVVEDEESISDLIANNLKLVGHHCVQIYDGPTALEVASKQGFDLILMDVMLPNLSGFEVMEQLGETPVIFLTALDSLNDRIKGFNLGADDYITKPFETLELLARVHAVLRRTQKNAETFEANGTKVSFSARTVSRGHECVEITPKEFDLLEVLIMNRNIALSREKLLELAWGFDYFGETRTVDNHIQKLRAKLHWEDIIKTIYKLGYRLEI